MSKKSLVLLTLLAVVPLLAFAWLGWRISRAESLRAQQQLRRLLNERIREENRKLQRYFARLQRDLGQSIVEYGDDASALRKWCRENPVIRQAIVLNQSGDVVHPRISAGLNQDERAFLSEIQQMLVDKDLVRLAFPRSPKQIRQQQPSPQSLVSPSTADRTQRRRLSSVKLRDDLQSVESTESTPTAPDSDEGWCTWYWGRGVHLMYWHRWNADRVTMVAISRARWMADVLSLLPSTAAYTVAKGESPERIRLVDSSDRLVYQWGSIEPASTAIPLVDEPLAAPLSSWRFKYFVDPSTYDRSNQLPILASLIGLACALIGLIMMLYRDYSRDMLEATQRVNFVNQVSHELKTPLTNIRLYADLLQHDLDHMSGGPFDKPRSRVDIISSEAQRLSRLISNVLTFARSERNQLQIRRQSVNLDHLVREIVDRFEPLFVANSIELQLVTNVGVPVQLDPDAVEQILDNLISNVVRYASGGGYLSVRTQIEETQVTVEVSDQGPGISHELARVVFEPFVRGASGLSDATGTGIGLSIARRLARLHGGDLIHVARAQGATFLLTLPRRNDHEGATR